MKLTTGVENYEIYSAGTIIAFKGESITFHLDDDLAIILSFVSTEDKTQKMDFKVLDDKKLEVFLTNFDNSLGISNAAPLPLARINNKQVYLNFAVYTIGQNESKIVHYTWYLREEVANA